MGFRSWEATISLKKMRLRWGKYLCFIRGFCLVSIYTMLNKDVEKYVPINLSGTLPIELREEFCHDSAVEI